MSIETVLEHLATRVGDVGVNIQIADINAETGERGFSVGMQVIQRHILLQPQPTVVIGLERPDSSDNSAPVLQLPFVQFLELPFTRSELEGAVAAAKRAPINGADIAEARRVAATFSIERLRRNVSHVLDGGIVGLVEVVVGAVESEAKRGHTRSAGDWEEYVAAVTQFCGRLEQVRNRLLSGIRDLDGIAPPQVASVLGTAQSSLAVAQEMLAKFAEGLKVWSRGDCGAADPQALIGLAAKFVAATKRAQSALQGGYRGVPSATLGGRAGGAGKRPSRPSHVR